MGRAGKVYRCCGCRRTLRMRCAEVFGFRSRRQGRLRRYRQWRAAARGFLLHEIGCIVNSSSDDNSDTLLTLRWVSAPVCQSVCRCRSHFHRRCRRLQIGDGGWVGAMTADNVGGDEGFLGRLMPPRAGSPCVNDHFFGLSCSHHGDGVCAVETGGD